MSEIKYGAKYNKDLTRTQIAALIRKDITAALKAGELPKGLKTSVRKRNGSIDVEIVAVPAGFRILSDASLKGEHVAPMYWQTEQAREVLAKLEEIHAAYNFDGSDIVTDYFHVNYYGRAAFDWQLTDAERKAFAAAKAAPKAEPQVEFMTWAGVA